MTNPYLPSLSELAWCSRSATARICLSGLFRVLRPPERRPLVSSWPGCTAMFVPRPGGSGSQASG